MKTLPQLASALLSASKLPPPAAPLKGRGHKRICLTLPPALTPPASDGLGSRKIVADAAASLAHDWAALMADNPGLPRLDPNWSGRSVEARAEASLDAWAAALSMVAPAHVETVSHDYPSGSKWARWSFDPYVSPELAAVLTP